MAATPKNHEDRLVGILRFPKGSFQIGGINLWHFGHDPRNCAQRPFAMRRRSNLYFLKKSQLLG
jgi:hypothetical protein